MSDRQTKGGRDTQTANLDNMSSDGEDSIPRKTQIAPVARPRKTISNSQERDYSSQKKSEISPNRRQVHEDSDSIQRESAEECYSDDNHRKSRRHPVRQNRNVDNEVKKSASSNKETPRKTTTLPTQSMEFTHDSFSDEDTDHRMDSKCPTKYRKNNSKYKDDKYSKGDLIVKSSPPSTQSEDDTNHNNVKLEGSKPDDTISSSDPDDNSSQHGSRRRSGSPEINYKLDRGRKGGRNKSGSRIAGDGTRSDSSSLRRQGSRVETRENEKARRGKQDRTKEYYDSGGSDSASFSRRKQVRKPEKSENKKSQKEIPDRTGDQCDSSGSDLEAPFPRKPLSQPEKSENEKVRRGNIGRTGENYDKDGSDSVSSRRRKQVSRLETQGYEKARGGEANRTGENYSSDGSDLENSSQRKQASRSETRGNERARRAGAGRTGEYHGSEGNAPESFSGMKQVIRPQKSENERARTGKTDGDAEPYSSDGSDQERFSRRSEISSQYEIDGTRRKYKNKKGRDDFNKGNDSDRSSRRSQDCLPERSDNEREQRMSKSRTGRQSKDDDNDFESHPRRKRDSNSRAHNEYDTKRHDSGDERGNKLLEQHKGDTTRKGDRLPRGRQDDNNYGTDSDDSCERGRSGRRVPYGYEYEKRIEKSRDDGRISSSHSQKEGEYLKKFSPIRVKPQTKYQDGVSEKHQRNYPISRRPIVSDENARRGDITNKHDVTRENRFDYRDPNDLEREQHSRSMHHSTPAAMPRARGNGSEYSGTRRNSMELDKFKGNNLENRRNLNHTQRGIEDAHQKGEFQGGYTHDNHQGYSWKSGHNGGNNYNQQVSGRGGYQTYTQGGNQLSYHKNIDSENRERVTSKDLIRPSVLNTQPASQHGGLSPSRGFSTFTPTSARLTDSNLLHILIKYPEFEASLRDLQKNGLGEAAIRNAVYTSKTQMFELDDKGVRLRPQVRLCDAYESREGCRDKSSCSGLHICSKYVLSNCSYSSCNFGHNFNTGHNRNILSPFGIPQESLREILKVSLAVPKASGKLQLCMMYNSSKCSKRDCDDLHICSIYLMNKLQCHKGRSCLYSHNFNSQTNARLLRKHGIDTNESPMDILKTLEEEHPSLFKQQQQKWHQPIDYQMSTGFQGRGNSSGTGLSSGPRMSATQGAMAKQGSERPFHSNDRQNGAFYGATGQTSNTSWSFHTEGSSIIDEICFHSVSGRCRNEATGCQRLHSRQHYHWQVNDMNKRWLNLRQNQVDELERAFCDPNIDVVKVPQPEENKTPREILSLFRQGTWHADFQSMQLQNRSIRDALPLRRLCSENVNGKVPASIYQWYFLDQNRAWVEYGNVDTTKRDFLVSNITSDDIERHFLTNPAQPLVFQNNLFKYVLDFNSMTQTNTQTNVSREVKRRPVPHMKPAGFLNNIISWVTPP